MQKWQYKTSVVVCAQKGFFDQDVNLEKMENPLNELGENGWELVTNYGPLTANGGEFLCLWKRPKQE